MSLTVSGDKGQRKMEAHLDSIQFLLGPIPLVR